MAGISSDYIQQELLNQSVAMNDNLSAMRQVLLDVEKNTKKSGSGGSNSNNNSGSGGSGNRNNNRRPPGGSFKNAFKDLFGEAGNIGKTVLGNNGSIANTVGAVSTSAKVLTKSLGMLPGPVGLVASGLMQIVQVGGMVYEYLNQQLEMYNSLNSAGLSLADGMMTVRKGSGSAFMSINEFGAALQKNSDAVAAMDSQYGDGVEHFGKLLNSVQLVQEQMGLYGVSQQQLADITAKNYKYQKMYSSQATLNSLDERNSTTQFVGQMTYLSKSVGKSVDELLARFSDLSTNIDSGAIMSGLQNRAGQTEKQAIDVNKTWTSMYASLGEFGKTAQKINASKWGLGSLPEEFNDTVSQQYADFMESVQRSGVTDQKTINQLNAKFIKEHEDQIKKQADIDRSVGNTTAEAFHRQMLQVQKTLNDPKNNPSPVVEDFTNRFNLWIGKTFTQPFSEFFGKSQENAIKYLNDLNNRSTDGWDFFSNLLSDAFTKFNLGMLGPLGQLMNFPNKLMTMIFGDTWTKVTASFSKLGGDIIQIPVRIGKLIWEMFTGSSSDVDKAGKEVMGSIKRVFSSVSSAFSSLTKLDFSMDDVKKNFKSAFESLKNKLSSTWARVKSWWSDSEETTTSTEKTTPTASKTTTPTASQPKTAGVQTVTAPPEYTRPEKIEQADQTAPEQQKVANTSDTDSANKLLAAILNNLEMQGQNSSQLAIIMRQIADNTEPPRNI